MSKASYRVFTFQDLTFQSNSMLLHLHTSLHTTTHFTVILAWASPTSLAVTKGIIVIFFSSAQLDASIQQVFLLDLRLEFAAEGRRLHRDEFGTHPIHSTLPFQLFLTANLQPSLEPITNTQTSILPKEVQCAFKDLMTHRVLQFALPIAFRCVLHRFKSQDIHRDQLLLRSLIPIQPIPHFTLIQLTTHNATHRLRGERHNSQMILPQVHLRKPCYDFTFL